MKLSKSQKNVIRAAGKTNSSRIYAMDYPSQMQQQAAFHKTCRSLVNRGLMEQAKYSNNALMNAYELTPEGRHFCEMLKAGKI